MREASPQRSQSDPVKQWGHKARERYRAEWPTDVRIVKSREFKISTAETQSDRGYYSSHREGAALSDYSPHMQYVCAE